MDKIVSNATPLIYLAKAGRLDLLQSLVEGILIPDVVYREVVVEGKRLKESDAHLVERAVADGWICRCRVKENYHTEIAIHPGERDVISLARQRGVERVLMDDAKARLASEMAGLKPKGTLWVILMGVKRQRLNFEQFLAALEDITRSGFYLKEEVYLRAVREAEKLTKAQFF